MKNALELQDDQKFALMKFRRNVHDLLRPEFDDYFLVRWLKARKWNPEAAEKMLREYLKFRESMKLDEIEDWNPKYNFDPYCPYGFLGFSSSGHPVVLVPLEGLDVNGFLKSLHLEDLARIALKLIERYMKIAYDYSKTNGFDARQFIVIVDFENFLLRQYMNKPCINCAIFFAKMIEANYPLVLKKVFIINAPSLFTIAYNIVKPFLSSFTVNSVKIYNSDRKKWVPAMLELVDAHMLPESYGGTMVDEDGDPKCSKKICYGGKIPTEWYSASRQASIENLDMDLEQLEAELNAVILKEAC